MNELDLEKSALKLIGQRLARVRYQRADWTESGWQVPGHLGVHSVGVAVYLETSLGAIHRVYWADELGLRHGFGISVSPIKVPHRDAGPIQDLSVDPLWQPILDNPITAARIHWRDIRDSLRSSLSIGVAICADHLSRQDYPQSLELVFQGGQQVFFSAADLPPGDDPILFTNNILVLFGSPADPSLV